MSRFIIFDDFMRIALFFYNINGLRLYQPRGGNGESNRWRYLQFILHLANINFILGLQILYVFLSLKKRQYIDSTIIMSYIGFVIVGECKTIAVYMHKSRVTNFIREMESIFPSQKLSDQQNYRLSYYLQRTRQVMLGFAFWFVMTVSVYAFYPIVSYFIQYPEIKKSMPFVQLSPWNYQDNWVKYIVFYAMQVIGGYSAMIGHISSNLLIFANANQLIMHFEYLTRTLEEYEVQAKIVSNAYQKDLEFLQSMITYHNKLLSLTDDMNNVFGVPLLLNFSSSSVLVCFIGFLMTIGVRLEAIKLFLFLVCCLSEIYLMCYYSQLLIDASASVAVAVYNMHCWDADPRFRKMLILMALRAQKPIYLKATAFLHISMNTMTSFIQTSYKFFALLRTIYQ